MNNEKLMQIVQAVNDSRAEPIDVDDSRYDCIAISRGFGSRSKGEVHAVNNKCMNRCWEKICTVEEFNQCVKEMSEGYSKKEVNKHPHHDLIVEWARDTSKVVQVMANSDGSWHNSPEPQWRSESNYRFKPREFVKGHWYPCFYNDGSVYVKIYNGESFYSSGDCTSISFSESEFSKIGKSLGEFNFGGGE